MGVGVGVGLFEHMPLLRVCRALLGVYMAVLRVLRALLRV